MCSLFLNRRSLWPNPVVEMKMCLFPTIINRITKRIMLQQLKFLNLYLLHYCQRRPVWSVASQIT